jgi:hypothetical protein
MMNLNERTFRIGAVDYTVELVPKLAHLHEVLGQVSYDDTNIQLEADMSPTRRNDVLVHELLHAIFFEAGYGEQDEDTINRVGHVLAQVLRDNDFGFMRGESDQIKEAFDYAKELKDLADKSRRNADHEQESEFLAEYSGAIRVLQILGFDTAKEESE